MPLKEISNTEKKDKSQKLFYVIQPKFTFENVILADETVAKIKQVLALYEYNSLIFEEWGLNKVIQNQKRLFLNFYGNPGTGKTMTAHAIASYLKKSLLIVNYAEIESKFVGDTSKNLIALFEYARSQDCVILFDEADALLSKRVTSMSSASDVSVNQTRNVLLKILDEYEGIVIFTTNFFENFDHAFLRRIYAHIELEMPDKKTRNRLWEHYLVEKFPISEKRNMLIDKLSDYEDMSGADIANAMLKTAGSIALAKRKFASFSDFEEVITAIQNTKEKYSDSNIQMTIKKVSKKTVEDKLGGTL